MRARDVETAPVGGPPRPRLPRQAAVRSQVTNDTPNDPQAVRLRKKAGGLVAGVDEVAGRQTQVGAVGHELLEGRRPQSQTHAKGLVICGEDLDEIRADGCAQQGADDVAWGCAKVGVLGWE